MEIVESYFEKFSRHNTYNYILDSFYSSRTVVSPEENEISLKNLQSNWKVVHIWTALETYNVT